MADIFLSYSSRDLARARDLVSSLEDRGRSVWWDRTIPPGKTFDEVLESALANAKCVVVLWSQDSIQSDWVKTEAAEAKRRAILVPVLIDDVAIPLEFRRIQAARLVDTKSGKQDPELEQLLMSIDAVCGNTPRSVHQTLGDGAGPAATDVSLGEVSRPQHRWKLLGGLATIAAIAAVAGIFVFLQSCYSPIVDWRPISCLF